MTRQRTTLGPRGDRPTCARLTRAPSDDRGVRPCPRRTGPIEPPRPAVHRRAASAARRCGASRPAAARGPAEGAPPAAWRSPIALVTIAAVVVALVVIAAINLRPGVVDPGGSLTRSSRRQRSRPRRSPAGVPARRADPRLRDRPVSFEAWERLPVSRPAAPTARSIEPVIIQRYVVTGQDPLHLPRLRVHRSGVARRRNGRTLRRPAGQVLGVPRLAVREPER